MQENQQVMNRYEDDEIDLRELFRTLMKNRVKIVVITSLITIGAVIYAYMVPKIYEVKSNVQVGFIGQDLITEPDILVKRLNLVYNIEDKVSSGEGFVSEVSSISANKKLKNFIEIKTQAISNDEALKKNKEVVEFIQKSYQSKMDQYILDLENSIKNVKRKINNIDSFEIKNIQQQIELLNTQKIVKIDEKINFYKNIKLKSLESKINFHTKKLKEYIEVIENLYNNNNSDKTTSIISSIQMVNYQNLILNSQNKIEDLKIEKEIILNEKIVNLEREKENIKKDSIRKLEYKINVELVNKKINLTEEIGKLKFMLSNQNVQNSKVIGDYVLYDYPIKPKKKLIVVVAFITGLILSIFLVFFMEFIKGSKEEEG